MLSVSHFLELDVARSSATSKHYAFGTGSEKIQIAKSSQDQQKKGTEFNEKKPNNVSEGK
ncbi:hypothetical protein BPOR_0152g00100 [Botrytis porri]|uniref:Uncharacterized protein n=1 Tax=Botrytis porri TaxID=87229 RepID=A0A4Z1KVN0_9HELO|nr:hypothetical protein BPOR_0152g00100 [Botrytis porri]